MSRRKLLLADDSITIQKVVNLTFADEGIEVTAVGDGNSALDKMMEIPPDLVMADVNMPGLSGYDLCERIKQTDRLRHIPVILLVGSFEPFDEAEAARVGADDFLTKPFQSIRQLVNKVTAMLDAGESTKAAAAVAGNAPVENFDDTIKMDAGVAEAQAAANFISAESSAGFGDAGMDDEMIQTARVGSFPLDEAQKFETGSYQAQIEDAAQTQPLSAHDLKDFSFVESQARDSQADERFADEEVVEEVADEKVEEERVEEVADEAVYEVADEPQRVEETPAATWEEVPTPAAQARPVPVFDFDDSNLLEIPFEEEETAAPSPASSETVTGGVSSGEADANLSPESYTGETQAVSAPDSQFAEEIKDAEAGKTVTETEAETSPETASQNLPLSPEVIDAIAQKVVEKLSARAVKEVAWEVVPQMADLIIQKMAEEKLKE